MEAAHEVQKPISQSITESEITRVLSVIVPESLHRELKVRCALDGQSIQDTVRVAIRAYLSQ
jgi:plasmid stability protein